MTFPARVEASGGSTVETDDRSPNPAQVVPTPTSFEHFPQLPKEVQDMIWSAALPGPRIIHATEKIYNRATGRGYGELGVIKAWSDIPAMLHVCHDAREIALKGYQLAFGSRFGYPTYFDPEKDIVLFPYLAALRWVRREGFPDLDSIKSVAITAAAENVVAVAIWFKNLRSLYLPVNYVMSNLDLREVWMGKSQDELKQHIVSSRGRFVDPILVNWKWPHLIPLTWDDFNDKFGNGN